MKLSNRIIPLLLLALAACQEAPAPGIKIGKPYTVEGKTYVPKYDPTYDQMGEASWYGPGFHGKYTANGEVYDQHELTAAHPTLPMPSLVRVTNLKNGRSEIIRINDRGPFKNSRIIDLSKASAEALGIKGVAKVRVQYLKEETESYVAGLPGGREKWRAMAAASSKGNPPSGQLVESTVANSDVNAPVSDAAPVLTVSSADLQPQSPTQQEAVYIEEPADNTGNAPKPGIGLIKQAWADDTVPERPPRPAAASPPAERYAVEPGGYYVQAGLFSVEQNALALAEKLRSYGTVDIRRIESAGRVLWRVRAGYFESRVDAERVVEMARASGAGDARVILFD